MRRSVRHAFTLVEILIVVVILGILAAIVIPQFTEASQESAATATYNELQKLRRHMDAYRARNAGLFPDVEEGNGTWGQIIGPDHLLSAPSNPWVGGSNRRRIVFADQPDMEYHTDYAWIYDPDTGQIWAGGFDGNDEPLPRNGG